MGIEYTVFVFGEILDFRENQIFAFPTFDQRNLLMCKYLNLRGSAFVDFHITYLPSLEFIDIRESGILELDLTCCTQLKTVVANHSQHIMANNHVNITSFTVPSTAPYDVLDTQQMYAKENVSYGTRYWHTIILSDYLKVNFCIGDM